MRSDSEESAGQGIGGSIGWAIGGVVGGAAGALVFGAVMWLFGPEAFSTAIPALYGIDSGGTVGWLLHLVHGIGLGLVFGFVVTRPSILGVLETDVETDVLARTGLSVRLAGAGVAFGLAAWAILPVMAQPIVAGAVGGEPDAFPAIAVESMTAHLAFGAVLGTVFATVVDLRERPRSDPLGEEGERATAGADR